MNGQEHGHLPSTTTPTKNKNPSEDYAQLDEHHTSCGDEKLEREEPLTSKGMLRQKLEQSLIRSKTYWGDEPTSRSEEVPRNRQFFTAKRTVTGRSTGNLPDRDIERIWNPLRYSYETGACLFTRSPSSSQSSTADTEMDSETSTEWPTTGSESLLESFGYGETPESERADWLMQPTPIRSGHMEEMDGSMDTWDKKSPSSTTSPMTWKDLEPYHMDFSLSSPIDIPSKYQSREDSYGGNQRLSSLPPTDPWSNVTQHHLPGTWEQSPDDSYVGIDWKAWNTWIQSKEMDEVFSMSD